MNNRKNFAFYIAMLSWLSLMILMLLWDWLVNPLHTGRWLLLIKLVPLLLPLRGIISGRVYTYQYCSMLILLYFTEGVMRVLDNSFTSRLFATLEIMLSLLFFVTCLAYLKQFKIKKLK